MKTRITFTTKDGVEYNTAGDGSRRRITPKYSSKRDRREQIKERQSMRQELFLQAVADGRVLMEKRIET